MIKDRFKHQMQHLEATNRNNRKEAKQKHKIRTTQYTKHTARIRRQQSVIPIATDEALTKVYAFSDPVK